MQCTPAEIEQKRREAQAKLAKKLQSPLKNQNSFPLFKNASPVSAATSPKFKFNNRFSNETQSKPFNRHCTKPYEKPQNQQKKPVMQFYGKDKIITAKFVLYCPERFNVEMSEFSTPAIEIFKTIPTRNYDSKTRNWSFNVRDHGLVLSKIRDLNQQPNLGRNFVIEKIPQFVLNCLNSLQQQKFEVDFNRLDPELNSALMPFQQEGLSFGVERKGRCLIADDMGLGKTFQALAIADYYREDWPLLIVTTASMKNVWEETIIKYLPSVSVMHIQYMTSGKDYIGDAKVLITSHDLMSRCIEKLLERNFGVLIIDESHILKNFKTKVTKSATQLAKKAKRVVLLSGTPALSRPSELYTQLSLIDDKFFGSFFEYSRRYCDGKETNFGWDASGKSNLKELEVVLLRKFMIRRTKEDVLKALPNKVQEVVNLDVHLEQFSEEDRKCLNALADRYSQQNGKDKHSILLTFFAETAKIKIPSVCSYILQILESKKKFLVFAHHQIMLNAIENIVKKKNLKYIRIDGNTNGDQRKYFVDKFQLDDSYVCAILSITAANAGITLTAAQLVLFAELHWNPSILSQAEARAHRIGQEGAVVVQYLTAKGTADDSIWPLLQEKQKILSEVGLLRDSFDGVAVKKQDTNKHEDLTDGLNITTSFPSNVTSANTLDITTYFKSPEKKPDLNKSNDFDVEELFDDGLDDILGNINF